MRCFLNIAVALSLFVTTAFGAGSGTMWVTSGFVGGSATISGAVTVGAAGSLYPGATVGTLAIDGNLDISAMVDGGSGKLAFDLGALTESYDQITAAGTLTIGDGKLGFGDFIFANPSGVEIGTYTLITSSGISGSLDAAPNLRGVINGFNGTITISGNNITLVVTVRTPYEIWLDDNGKTGTPADLNEYAFGTTYTGAIIVNSPTSITLGQAPAMKIAGSTISALYGRRQNYQASRLIYRVMFSANLSTWHYSTDTVNLKYLGTPDLNNPVVVASENGMDAVSVPFPLFIKTANGYERTKAFMQVEVTAP